MMNFYGSLGMNLRNLKTFFLFDPNSSTFRNTQTQKGCGGKKKAVNHHRIEEECGSKLNAKRMKNLFVFFRTDGWKKKLTRV